MRRAIFMLCFGTGGAAGEYEATLVDSVQVSHRYVVHVPPSYDAQRGTPVLVHFHGLASSLPFDIKKKLDALWTTTSDASGFLAVAPESPPCPSSATDTDPVGCWDPTRDSQYVKDLVAQVAKQYNVDRDRVYLSGHSNGAFFVDASGLLDSANYAAIVEWEGGCDDSTSGHTKCINLDKMAKAAVRKTPYFTIHFPDDMDIPASWTFWFVSMLDDNGFPHTTLDNYDGYKGGGNGHTPDPAVAPKVWAWLSTNSLP